MGWFKKGPPPKKESVWCSTLRIEVKVGRSASFTAMDVPDDVVWKRFYHWYYGRPQSETYMFCYKKGSQMIRRDNIVGFRVDKHYL